MPLSSALLPVLSHALPESSRCHCQVPCSLYSHMPFLSLVPGCHCQVPCSLYSHMPFLSLVDVIVKCPTPCTLTYLPESSGCHCQVPILPVLSYTLPESSGCHCQVPCSLYSHTPFLSLVDAIVKCPAPCTLTCPS